uniref:Putative secreted protein n=1 Tax=Ixodes ricinus TaxID=34613 RepID=A0A6B0UHS7_IXORI
MTCRLRRWFLASLAFVARTDVEVDSLRELGPVVFLSDPCKSPTVAKVTRCWVVVARLEDLFSKTSRNHQEPRRVAVPEVLFVEDTSPDSESWQIT